MLYRYKAIRDGGIESKKIDADSEKEVISYLKERDLIPVEIKALKNQQLAFLESIIDKVSFSDIVNLTRQLAIMLNAGLTIVDSLDILKQQLTKAPLKELIEEIDKEVKSGNPLSSVLKKYPQYFSDLYISLIKSGEASGKLSDILLRLSDNLEKQREFRAKLKGAMIYPAAIVSAMLIVMFVMVTFVLPKMLDLYKSFDVELPITTQILIAVSTFSQKFWPLIIIAVAGGISLFRRFSKTKRGKLLIDGLLFRLPVLSNVIKKAALVDTTRTLSILVGAGVSILDALDIVIDTTTNSIYKEAFENIYKKIEKGESLGNALSAEQVFPPIFVQMTMVGENTGHLDDTLLRLSNYFEFESETATKALTTLIEPVILVVLGVAVGFLVLSVITPIYKLTSSFNK